MVNEALLSTALLKEASLISKEDFKRVNLHKLRCNANITRYSSASWCARENGVAQKKKKKKKDCTYSCYLFFPKGDEILEWNTRPLRHKSYQDVHDIIAESKQESQVELLVLRKKLPDKMPTRQPCGRRGNKIFSLRCGKIITRQFPSSRTLVLSLKI